MRPIHALRLEAITIRKEEGKYLSIQSGSGAFLFLKPSSAEALNDWISSISECTKENSNSAEVNPSLTLLANNILLV